MYKMIRDRSKMFNVDVQYCAGDDDAVYYDCCLYEHYNNGDFIKDECPEEIDIMKDYEDMW